MYCKELLEEWRRKFNQCLELEFSNPDYFKVHHILVPTYLLQVGLYAEDVRENALQQLKEFLVNPEEIPSKSAMLLINKKIKALKEKKGGLLSSKVDLQFAERSILGVRTDAAEHYRNDIVEWSKWVVNNIDKT